MPLKWRLAAYLALLLVTLAVTLAWAGRYASQLYFQEVNQKLNASVAMYVVDRLPLMAQGQVNQVALQELAERAMTVNPSVEVYLLDPAGRIVEHVLPPEVIQVDQVRIAPIRQFLDPSRSTGQGLVLGDDPRGLGVEKVFSAAEIIHAGELQGYLYVVLGGAQFDAVRAEFLNTFIGRLSLFSLLVVIVIGGVVGYYILNRVTRPLAQLELAVQQFAQSDFTDAHAIRQVPDSASEVSYLKQTLVSLSQQLSDQLDQLATNDRLRRELLANVSHDLRTPLASMQGYVETLLIKQDRLTDTQQQQYLQTALKHTQRLHRLVIDLFELAKLDSGAITPKVERFALAELLQDVMQEFQLMAQQKNVQLRLQVDPKQQGLQIAGDISLIERVFENLLSNALRYTPAEGQVVIRLQASQDPAEGVYVELEDSGCGIEPELLPHLFDRYAQGGTALNEDGAGLGLAIVKRILELHGADIEVSSQLSVGTQFRFALPASQAA